jgi:hypothetical protein
MLEVAVEGELGLPNLAHLEAVLGQGRNVKNSSGRRIHVEIETRHDSVVLVGCDPRPVHEHRDSHSSPSLTRRVRDHRARGASQRNELEPSSEFT